MVIAMIVYEHERSEMDNYLYHQNDTNLNFPVHMHNSYEFIAVFSGEIELTIEDKTYTLKENDCTLLLPKLAHSYTTKDYSKTYLCVFSADFIPEFYKKTKNKIAQNPIFQIDDSKEISLRLQNSRNIFETESILYGIVSVFYSSTEFNEIENPNTFVHKLLSYVENHFQENISLKTVADNLGYTYNYTSTLFNQTFKTSFTAFLNNYRICYSIHLLISTKKTISDIAALSGYDSIRAFNRNFKEINGITPSQYRATYLDSV